MTSSTASPSVFGPPPTRRRSRRPSRRGGGDRVDGCRDTVFVVMTWLGLPLLLSNNTSFSAETQQVHSLSQQYIAEASAAMLFCVWLCVAAVQEARANYYCFGAATAHEQTREPRVTVRSIYNHVRTRLPTFLTEASKGNRCLCGSCCYRRHRLCQSRPKLEALRCGRPAQAT